LAYSRIRKVGSGDYERTGRQRRVLDAIIKKVNSSGTLKFPVIAAAILPFVETSMSRTDILKTGIYILNSGINNVEQQRFPMDGYCRGKIINDVWYLVTDIENTKKQMRNFIYEPKSGAVDTMKFVQF